MSKYYIGFDIGKSGGIYVLANGKPAFKHRMPLIGREIDIMALYKIIFKFKGKDAHVIFENIKGLFGIGKTAAMDLSVQRGIIEAICVGAKLPYTIIGPKKWQNEMFKDAKVQYKTSTRKDPNTGEKKSKKAIDTKATALLVAKRLFPQEDFLATERSKKPHDGLVDACLLAEYGRRRGL